MNFKFKILILKKQPHDNVVCRTKKPPQLNEMACKKNLINQNKKAPPNK